MSEERPEPRPAPDRPEREPPDEDESLEMRLPEGFRNDETEALVERAKDGDADALNELFQRYHGLMVEVAQRRLGARLRQKEEADDLVQTTFREATRDFRRYVYRGEGSLLRWLVQILHNKIRDKAEFYSARKRDISRERALEDSESESAGATRRYEPASPDLSVTRQVVREEEFGILRDALGRLSPEHRTAITLVFFQGMSLREAGERMEGRSEDAVRMLLRRAEARLRELTRVQLERDPDEKREG